MNWELEVQHQYHRELIAEADEMRMVRELRRNNETEPKFNPALAWVGQRLADITKSLTNKQDDSAANN